MYNYILNRIQINEKLAVRSNLKKCAHIIINRILVYFNIKILSYIFMLCYYDILSEMKKLFI